jgi:hypothetical protein
MSTAELSLPFPEDPWGPHRAAVAGRLETCSDYLGRLQRSLTGEAAPDRLYFSTRAHDLYEAARDLVRLTEDVEHWLIRCDERLVEVEPDGEVESQCELPRNHYGGHTSHPPEALAAQVRTSAHELMDEAEATARWVNRLGLLSDQRRAFEIEKEFDPEWHEVLDSLEQAGAGLVYRAERTSGLFHTLANEMPQEEWDEMDRYIDEDDVDDEGRVIEPPAPEGPLPPARRPRGLDL